MEANGSLWKLIEAKWKPMEANGSLWKHMEAYESK